MATKKKVENPARNPAFKTDLDLKIIKGWNPREIPMHCVAR